MILIVIAIIIYLLSFFKQSKLENLEKQVEQLSLSMIQESYHLKKQIKVLQEELMIDSFQSPRGEGMHIRPIDFNNTLPVHTQIIHFHKEGYSIQEIAKQTSLPLEEVRLIIQQQHWGGRS